MKVEQKRLIPQIVEIIRRKQYSYSTEKTYVSWILRYIRFHDKKHPKDMGEKEIMQFLSHLANKRRVSASTQNQALNAIVFLYREVLKRDLGDFSSFARAKKSILLPVVLSRQEISEIISHMNGTYLLMTGLIYGCGLRLKECLRLRVKDIDFHSNQVWIRLSKGKKDRVVPLPGTIKNNLREYILKVKKIHDKDLKEGYGSVFLPYALDRKYPNVLLLLE